ncbi:alkaline phosphatase family protein [Streptacidiphilus sp. P02-A3a]|uniref:alkaline phosphatase family protein n=1 Tax=Streptacidiphilus sp. P02-A3a TaxID=2704468 RepID=UPI0015FC6ADD|nr:alkaline phosphatase family protein [Streptacidiphilus sp. P02-A3a]QMU71825.1 alkaline phosphatase family protein [Streptacidiphilus sp. P02-A3a]
MVVLGIDGLSYTFAAEHWSDSARVSRLRSVFPTTSSAGWLSSLTGLDVAQHLVPGVVFADPEGSDGLINVFDYQGRDLTPARETVFTDARRLGYRPHAVLGDMETYGGSWRDALLRDADPVLGHRFYTPDAGPYRERPPELLVDLVRNALHMALAGPGHGPRLVWCYVELDRHVHHFGYDRQASRFLTGIGQLARELADAGTIVLAHADHGLTATRPDPDLAELLDASARKNGFRMGGAGRTRWLYPAPGTADDLAGELAAELPESVRLARSDELFCEAARSRVGELVLVAEGEAFLADPGYRYEHGSLTDAELDTPYAVWMS